MRLSGIMFLLAGLMGCSAGSSGTGGSRSDAAATLAASLEGENVSNPSTLPKTGTATYEGFVTLDLPIGGVTSERVGDLDMTVDFGAAADHVTGEVTHLDGLGGSLSISGGDLDRATNPNVDFTYNGNIGGTLTDGADSYLVDGSFVGEFRGRNQAGITGLVYGNITGPDGQDLFDGTLSATRSD